MPSAPEKDTILFLYTRLPDYLYQCALHFVRNYSAEVVIVRYRDDANTKYSFVPDPSIRLVYKSDVDLTTFIRDISPVAIILSGWSDQDYTRAARAYRSKIPVVLGLDNPWLGTFRQKLLVASTVIRNIFNAVWVAGRSQYEYASRLGFRKKNIFSDLYCADTDKFYKSYSEIRSAKTNAYPKKIVYTGRLVEYKQPDQLAHVFNKVASSGNYDWKLVIAGEGPLKPQILEKNYAHVSVVDFVAPESMVDFYRDAGAFCLPSVNEHWGLAVHEAAAAGLPLLLSDTVESGSAFLIDYYNGYSFATGDERSLEDCIRRLIALSDEKLLEMSDNSVDLSHRINHSHWSAQLNKMLNSGGDA